MKSSQVDRAAAKAEVERLNQLSTVELAVAIMPAFGSDGLQPGKLWWGARGIEILQICDWLMRRHAEGYRSRPRLRSAVTRALHLLEDAGLIENARRWTRVGALGATLRSTALGERTLAEGTVRECLSGPVGGTGAR
jgi:hypothetical protein